MMADSNVLWVGGLHEKVTEELLYELFLQTGPLDRVTIPKDKDGRNRNFAFINFKHDESVPYTMQLFEGMKLFGQYLRIQTRSGQPLGGAASPQSSTSPYSSPQYPSNHYQDNREMYQPQGRGNYHGSSPDASYQDNRDKGSYNRATGSNIDTNQQDQFRSPRDREQGSRSHDSQSRYHRSHTWHGGDKGSSSQYRQDPQLTNQYAARSPQYQSEAAESTESRHQRVLHQQSLSLAVNRHAEDGRGRRDYDRMQPYQRPSSSRRRY